MHRIFILFTLASVSLATYKKSRPCYMCEYRPPKTTSFKVPITEDFTVKVSRNVRQCRTKRVPVNLVYGDPGYAPRRFKVTRTCRPKVVYDVQRKQRTRYEVKYKTKPAGGFSACKGPLEAKSAKAAGVDTWRCDDNCFIRKDAQNNTNRGCFKGESGVNPNDPKPQEVHGYTYRFCVGGLCNSN